MYFSKFMLKYKAKDGGIMEKRIKELPIDYWREEVSGPLTKFGVQTKSELFHLLLSHEAMHLGQIQSLKKLVERHKTTNQY